MTFLPGLKKDSVLRAGAWFVLLAAILPNAVYLGHGPLTIDIGHSEAATVADHHHPLDTTEDVPATDEHSLHCHTGPSRCGGAQSLVGSIWVGEDAGLLALDTRPQLMSTKQDISPTGVLSAKILQPPKPAAV